MLPLSLSLPPRVPADSPSPSANVGTWVCVCRRKPKCNLGGYFSLLPDVLASCRMYTHTDTLSNHSSLFSSINVGIILCGQFVFSHLRLLLNNSKRGRFILFTHAVHVYTCTFCISGGLISTSSRYMRITVWFLHLFNPPLNISAVIMIVIMS